MGLMGAKDLGTRLLSRDPTILWWIEEERWTAHNAVEERCWHPHLCIRRDRLQMCLIISSMGVEIGYWREKAQQLIEHAT